MALLHLTLTKQWFDMIASGAKKEEYRELKPYWVKRLLGDVQTTNPTADFDFLIENINSPAVSFCTQDIDTIRFKNGYARDAPVMEVEVLGIRVGAGAAIWGAEQDKKYFVFQLGKVLTIKNYKP